MTQVVVKEYTPNFSNNPFGVEIECVCSQNISRQRFAELFHEASGFPCQERSYDDHALLNKWKIKSDGSIRYSDGIGIELVSPILSGVEGLKKLTKAIRTLR